MRLRPSPAPHRLQPLPVGRGVSTRPRPSTTSCFHLLLPPHRPGLPPRCHATPDALSLSGSLSPLLLCFLSPWPSMPTAANVHHRGHDHPRAAPSYPQAPPPRSLPPHRATQPEGPRSAAPMLFSSSAAGDPPRRPARSDASPSSPFASSQPP